MALSVDLRKRVITAIDEGMRPVDAAKLFKINRRTIYDWLSLRKETNNLEPKSGYQNGHSHAIKDWDQFKEFVENNKNCTIREMVVEWKKLTNATVVMSVIQRALKKIGYTSKKKLLTTSKRMPKNVRSFWKKSKI